MATRRIVSGVKPVLLQPAQDGLAQMLGQRAPVGMARALGILDHHAGDELVGRHGGPQGLHQAGVAHVRRLPDSPASRVAVAQRHRQHRRLGRDGGLQQVGVKRQQGLTVARGAFGEHRDHVAALRSASAIWCTTRMASRRDSRSMYSVPRRRPASPRISGQCLTSALETKRAGCAALHDQDVEPGNVVGHQQHGTMRRRRALHHQLDAQDAQHLRATTRATMQPCVWSGVSEPNSLRDDPQAAQHMHHERAPAATARQLDRRTLTPASGARPRTRPAHPPAWCARGPAARGLRTACACPGCAARPGSTCQLRVGVEEAQVGQAAHDELAHAVLQRAQRIAQHRHRPAA